MNWNHPNAKTLITGPSGSGKTELWIRIILAWKARKVFVFDPERQFALRTGQKVCTSVEHLNWALANCKFVVFCPSEMFGADRVAAFEFFCRWVFEQCKRFSGVKLFCVDEVQDYQRAGIGGLAPAPKELVLCGRRYEIDMAFIAHRINQVNADLRGTLSRVVTFRHFEPKCLDTLEEWCFDRKEVSALAPVGACIDRDVTRGGQQIINDTRKHAIDPRKPISNQTGAADRCADDARPKEKRNCRATRD